MTKRNYVRIISFTLFVLAVVVALAIVNTVNMVRYKNQLELNYQQSLTQLAESLDGVKTNLNKSMYSNSSSELYTVSRELYTECAAAKDAVSSLPVEQTGLGNTYKFLSQAGDYSLYLSDKLKRGEKLTQEEYDNLAKLLKYAEKFSDSAEEMVSLIDGGARITNNQVRSGSSRLNASAISTSSSKGEDSFSDYPTMLYDGPFSDKVINRESVFLTDKKAKTKEECKAAAAKSIGVNESKMVYESDDKGKIPCYTFKCGRYTVSVTKVGGYIKSIIYSGVISNSSITTKNAVNIAEEYLKSLGYDNMKENYYSVSNNICTINFAYTKSNICYYGDLVKVGISMEDGTPVTLEAETYLTNHTERTPFKAKITKAEAQKKISPYLTVKSSKLCVIPKDNGKEVNCYEFLTSSSKTGDDALVYINADTGDEEDIMLLLYSDNGTLVK